jgi:hypothetical protein|tara:strand:+ start:538 stop:981 length:444 start_codon:yes stop_codon:yes gene_type:complete
MASEIDNAVNDIITQIKDHTNNINTSEKKDTPDITNLEEFLIEKTSSLITSSIDMVEDVKEYISSAPENRDVASLAELIRASSSAIDTLTKLHTSTEQNKNRIEVKQMDVDSKEKLNTIDNQTKVLLSRDDVLQVLTNSDDSDIIDI